MMTVFELYHDHSDFSYGTMSFNGKFVFVLSDKIEKSAWNKIGFIKLSDESNRRAESKDLFRLLNSRLPITLREKTNEEKIDYIRKSGLRVASDGFYLKEVTGMHEQQKLFQDDPSSRRRQG